MAVIHYILVPDVKKVNHDHTYCLHPQANGIVERFHRQLKAALKARLVGPEWIDELPLVLLGLRSAPSQGKTMLQAKSIYLTGVGVP